MRDSRGRFRTGSIPPLRYKFGGGPRPAERRIADLEAKLLDAIRAGRTFNEAVGSIGMSRQAGWRLRQRCPELAGAVWIAAAVLRGWPRVPGRRGRPYAMAITRELAKAVREKYGETCNVNAIAARAHDLLHRFGGSLGR